MLGALLHQGVDVYASLAPDSVDVSSYAVPKPEPGRHDLDVLSADVASLDSAQRGATDGRSFRSVDVVRHRGRIYLATRTTSRTMRGSHVEVLSSEDEKTWRWEFGISRTERLFGPRLMSLANGLFVYVSVESSSAPGGTKTFASRLDERGDWTDLRDIGLDGHVVSRVTQADSVPLMTTHTGGADVFQQDDEIAVRLLTTNDGWSWHTPTAGGNSVYRGGGTDATFSSGGDGNLLAVVRNEAGDDSGWGSSVCIAPSSEWTRWDCVNDPKNYGAATTFTYDGEVYLVGQRQLSADGKYDQGKGKGLWRVVRNQAEQLTTAKRCSVWRYDRSSREFAFMRDLPSRGDTCAPAVVPGNAPGRFVVYGQSSDIHGPDLTAYAGRQQDNRLYRYELNFKRRSNTLAVSSGQ